MEPSDRSEASAFQHLAHLASRLLRAPMAVVSLRHGDRLHCEAAVGLPDSIVREGKSRFGETFCDQTVEIGEPLVVENARNHPGIPEFHTVRESGAVSYVAIRLVDSAGRILGVLAVMDRVRRRWSSEEVRDLQYLAQTVVTRIEHSCQRAERRRLEEALRQCEQRFRTLSEAAPVGIILTDSNGRCVFANERWTTISGVSQEQSLGLGWSQAIHPGDRERVVSSWINEGRTARAYRQEWRVLRPDGEVRRVDLRTTILRSEMGTLAGHVCIVEDVTEREQAEVTRRETEERFRQILLHMPAAVWTTDHALRFTSISGAESLVEPDYVLGRTLQDVHRESDPDGLNPDPIDAHLQALGGLRAAYEVEFRGRLFRARVMPLRRDGQVVGTIGVAVDKTEEQRAEASLRESEERFRQLAENIQEVFWLSDLQGTKAFYVSPAYRTIWGRDPQEVYANSQSWFDAIHEDDRDHVWGLLAPELIARDGFEAEYRIRRPDGEIRWIHARGFPVRNDAGEVYRLAGIAEDITERKEIEQALRLRERQFTEAQAVAGLGSWEWDVQRGIATWSDEHFRQWGYEPQSFMPTLETFIGGIHPEDRDRVMMVTERVLHDPGSFELEYRIVRPDGTTRVMQTRGHVVVDDDGRPIRLIGTEQDITERKQVEQELQAAKVRLEHLLLSSPGMLYTAEAEGDYGRTFMSPNVRDQLGYAPQDFTRNPTCWVENIDPEDRRRMLSDMSVLFERGRHTYQYRFRHKDGSWRWMRDEMRLLRDEAGKPQEIVGYWIDVTERKQVEAALAEVARMNARFATALQNLTTGVLITDPHQPDNPIIYTNPGFCAITGYSEDEILGRNCRFVQGPDTDPSTVREIHDAIAERKAFRGRILNYRKDGTPFWNELTISPVLDAQGDLINFVGLQSDVTEQVRVEEQIQAQLKEKTVLLQEVHHRVKNNLQIISSLLNLQTRAMEDPQAIRALQESRSRIHAIALAHETLYRSGSFASIDLADYLRALVQQLRRSYVTDRRIELKLNLEDCQVPLAQAVPCGLLASELVSNALKHAFPEDRAGEVRITLKTESDFCTLLVSDNGIGLPEDLDLGTTRSVGLQLVQDLVHQMKGTLELRRQPETEFRITFASEKKTA